MENKIIIARFMGLAEQLGMFECPITGTYVYPEYLKYDTSWDMLMLVVHKCLAICNESLEFEDAFVDAFMSCNIDRMYKEVLESINLYNTQ